MRLARSIALIAVLLCGGVASAKTTIKIRQPELVPPGKTLTMADAVSLALKNQPTVREAAAQVEFQKGAVSQGRSRLRPAASVSAATTIAGSAGSGGSSVSISGDQLIYDFGRSSSQLKQAERQLAASESALGAATENAVFGVKQSYYSLLRTTRLVQVLEENVKSQDEHVAQAKARFDVGLAPKSDVLNAAAAAASARVDLVTARNNEDLARVALNTAMGVDIRSATQIQETAESEGPVPTLDEVVDVAIKDRPEMRQAAFNLGAAEAALKAAETGNLPAITTSATDSKDFGGSLGNSNSWRWALNLQWDLFDSGFTRGAIMESRAQVMQNEESLYTVRQTVTSDVVTARLDLLAGQETLTSANAEVAAASENLDVATGRYRAGVGILLEVLDAQSALLKAEVDEASARYGLSTARAELERATGASAVEGAYK